MSQLDELTALLESTIPRWDTQFQVPRSRESHQRLMHSLATGLMEMFGGNLQDAKPETDITEIPSTVQSEVKSTEVRESISTAISNLHSIRGQVQAVLVTLEESIMRLKECERSNFNSNTVGENGPGVQENWAYAKRPVRDSPQA